MNILILLVYLLPWFRIFPAPSFFYIKAAEVPTTNLETVRLDNTYELYIKSICKKDSDGVVVPCNCQELGSYKQDKVVENEYLFLSRRLGKVVVINYIKDRNQKFYVNSDLKQQMSLLSSDSVKVNIWYFNQMRFGVYDSGRGELKFQQMSKPREKHIWKLETSKDGAIQIESVKKVMVDGFEEKTTLASLALVPKFYKADAFKLVFQKPYTEGNNEAPEFELPNNAVIIDTKDLNTYFLLGKEVHRKFDTIKFKSNRLYSYYPE